ncbi:hypothetical protein MEA186_09500 [Mesorhizobium amorphae CCNWGS0123]|uniref:Uncharacterized protein n=1 Tax=Mesorhizobium amorphae CCNWGS0123 TaxID=1082933 RepID=G6Y7I4_9HYPH|nr:hypothetical protein A6B35_14510 [Mesorhizobium amorphae CCNWGS0123]EHH12306.1 hypothetical protein MEA186_09500 [Mesorhizobium amorphae CCNWGS0123]
MQPELPQKLLAIAHKPALAAVAGARQVDVAAPPLLEMTALPSPAQTLSGPIIAIAMTPRVQ